MMNTRAGDNDHSNSFLLKLRKEKGLSQRALAKKLGICKTSLVHFEGKPPSNWTLGELETLADALDVKLEDLIMHTNGSKKEAFTRSDLKNPCFVLPYGEGVRIASFLPNPTFTFIGSITLGPHKTLLPEKTPKADSVFYHILDGILVVKALSKELVLKPGENLNLKSPIPYELYNPNQLKELTAILVTIPSFIPTPP